jgi:hypothetical protein
MSIGMAVAAIMAPNQVYSQATVTAKQICVGHKQNFRFEQKRIDAKFK